MQIEVSVCITTFNRKQLLPHAVTSILKQTYENYELLIIDDCSTDGTKEYLESELIKENINIRYIRHNVNKGLSCARNTAISNAKGRFFTFMDDDDEWDPDFIQAFMTVADQYDNTWCFCCGTKFFKNEKAISVIYDMQGPIEKYIRSGYTPPVAAQFYPIEMLRQVGGYDERIKSGVDHDLWLRLAYKGYNIKSISKALSHPNTNAALTRMTTDLSKRESGVLTSLHIWEKEMISYMGEAFYTQFVMDYKDHLKIGKIKKAFLERNIIEAVQLIISINSKAKFIKFFVRSINRKIFIIRHRKIIDKGLFGG